MRVRSDVDTKITSADQTAGNELPDSPHTTRVSAPGSNLFGVPIPVNELGMWLRALRSFFQVRNHPFSDAERAQILTRDWSNEVQVTRRTLLRCSHLAQRIINSDQGVDALIVETKRAPAANPLAVTPIINSSVISSQALVSLAQSLDDVSILCEALLDLPTISFHSWASVVRITMRELDRSDSAQTLMRAADHHSMSTLQPVLLDLARHSVTPASLAADILIVFSNLAKLLKYLRSIESALRRDQALKQTLPVFTLINEETHLLLDFIETRALRTDGINETVFDTLDGTNYAISMELRKVFSHELVGLIELRQAPPIYVKIENAHGLLRESFQQSMVGLARLFDPTLDGSRLFETYKNKLEQALALRRDLWELLQSVRRAKEERDRVSAAPLMEQLASFRQRSLRYLMYKDWEACERFMEEVAAARGVVELAPVLHRFATYLETLLGQVNMRAVLADYPFEVPI